jgi:transmembrane sensor
MSDALRLQLLFKKYLQRTCTASEIDELIMLLDRADADDILTPTMREVWEDIEKKQPDHKVDWNSMYAKITRADSEESSIYQTVIHTIPWFRYVAAAVVVVVAAIVYFSTGYTNKGLKQNVPGALIVEARTQERGSQKQSIQLPDGSSVVLNAGSNLKYPPTFSGKSRDVYLTGEGFFDIVHDSGKPFFVHSGAITIKVLGTAFNIKMDSAHKKIEVTVTRGKVQVLNSDKSVGIITASKQLLFDEATLAVITKTVDTSSVVAWKPAEIYFNDITLENAARKIEERFGIPVEFEHASAKNCRVTATFSEADQMEEMLAVVCAVSQTNYTISNNKIVINGKGCN